MPGEARQSFQFGRGWMIIIWLAVFLINGCGSQQGAQTANPANNSDPDIAEITATIQAPQNGMDLRGLNFDVVLLSIEQETGASDLSVVAGLQDWHSVQGLSGAELKLNEIQIDLQDFDRDQLIDAIGDVDPVAIVAPFYLEAELASVLAETGFPVVAVGPESGAEDFFQEGSLFGIFPPPEWQMLFTIQELWRNWEKVRPGGNVNELKVGWLDSGEGATDGGVVDALADSGYTVAVRAVMPENENASASNFILDSVAQGVTVLYLDGQPEGLAAVWNDIGALAVNGFFVVSGQSDVYDPEVSRGLGGSVLAGNFYTGLPFDWIGPAQRPEGLRLPEGTNQDSLSSPGYLTGLALMEFLSAGITLLVDDEDQDSVDPDALTNALDEISGGGMDRGVVLPKYSSGYHFAAEMRLWQVGPDGDWQYLGVWQPVPEVTVVAP